jgi:arginine deiminase
MWTVKSESGRLRSVLVHLATLPHWWKIPLPGTNPLASYRAIKQTYPVSAAAEEHAVIVDHLSEEGVKVYELDAVLAEVLSDSSEREKQEIIDQIWGESEPKPSPGELSVDHLISGYPPRPVYDEERDDFVVSERQRGSIYARDVSFNTPVGLFVSKMKHRGRREQPKVAKVAYERHRELREGVEIVADVNEAEEEVDLSPVWIEGGDVLILDEETILCGVGQRSSLLGLRRTMEGLFSRDETVKTVCAVRIPGPLPCGGHLDVFINFPDRRKALVMPYILDSELVPGFPERRLLTKLNEKLTTLSGLKEDLPGGLKLASFEGSGMCEVYRRDGDGRPVRATREKNLIDYLIREDKLDADGVIMTGGEPSGSRDVDHLITALQEGLREATNIVTIRPGLIIAYDRNEATNANLEDHGVRIKRLPTGHLDMLGGPHCMTMPLDRDAA